MLRTVAYQQKSCVFLVADLSETIDICRKKLGTPLEDALRRDITMNALFYNVHTRSVEDFTGKASPMPFIMCNVLR
jgi:hypothetical protein